MKSGRRAALILALTLGAAFPLGVQAAVVGHFTEVVGRVDRMKAGKPPVIEVKLKDTVEPGDIVRTKSEAKAQITFIDSTTMDIAPESRLGIEAYMYDLKKDQRHVVLQVFRGLVHTVVSRVYQVQEPDFIMMRPSWNPASFPFPPPLGNDRFFAGVLPWYQHLSTKLF